MKLKSRSLLMMKVMWDALSALRNVGIILISFSHLGFFLTSLIPKDYPQSLMLRRDFIFGVFFSFNFYSLRFWIWHFWFMLHFLGLHLHLKRNEFGILNLVKIPTVLWKKYVPITDLLFNTIIILECSFLTKNSGYKTVNQFLKYVT